MDSGSELAAVASDIDPLLAAVEMPFWGVYYPFGFPARIETNSRSVLMAAEANWARGKLRFEEPPVLLRVVVSDGPARECPDKPVYRAQRNLLHLVADRENFGCCDLDRGFGAAWLNSTVAAETDYLRYCFLEGMAASMIESLYLVSLHAACVARDGSGVLLSGDSGAGKSSLAYACARRGWTYVSDDCSSMVRRMNTRSVIGAPDIVRFRENASTLFPEIGGRKPRIHANGDPSIEIRTSEFPGIETAFESAVDHIVFLNRGPQHGAGAQLVARPREEARRQLNPVVWPAELASSAEREAAVERMLSAGIYELRYRDLDPAVERLEELARRGG